MAEKLVFDQTFDAFARALGKALTPEAISRLKAFGIDFDAKLRPAYPFDTWLQTMKLGAELLTPTGTRDQQYFNLGYRMVESYGETLIGRALLGMMKVIGPKRSLARMTRNLRTANNFTEVTMVEADGHTSIACSPVITPEFFRGMFTGAIEASGGSQVKVDVMSFVGERATYGVSWQ